MERARFARAKIFAFGSGQSAATYLVEFLTVAAGTGVAAHIEVSDNGRGPDAEDEYDALLATLGRTHDQDVRIPIHEAGHAVCARLLGNDVGGATVNPGPGYEGRVCGERHVEPSQ